MDNQNNPKLPDGSLNPNSFGAPAQPPPTAPLQTTTDAVWPPTQPSSTPLPTASTPTPWNNPTSPPEPMPQPAPAWNSPEVTISPPPPTVPFPPANNLEVNLPLSDTETTTNPTPAWSPPFQPPVPSESIPPTVAPAVPAADTTTVPSSASAWPPAVQPVSSNVTPTPTFTSPQPAPANIQPSGMSPLDNPWGAPTQPPPIDNSRSTTIQPSWTNISQNQAPENTPPPSLESVPTDLSHLINNNSQQSTTQVVPDTLTVPTPTATEIPTLPTEIHKGIPKWLIGVGVGLLILVVAASAYFILGVGQPTKTTTSLPAAIVTQPNETQQTVPATSIPQPVAEPTGSPVAGSANFGELQGNGSQTATSAADLLRQRQQGR